jgi:exodeoxyribonuclease VIII
MVDLETLGTRYGSPIVTLGAVLFDPLTQNTADELMKTSILRRIDMKDAIDYSLGVDADTLRWWFNQKDDAIKALVTGSTVTLKQALVDFADFATARDERVLGRPGGRFDFDVAKYPVAKLLWAKSPDFDAKMLEYAFDRLGLRNPFSFKDYRCVRTLQDLGWPNGPHTRPDFAVGTAHNAQVDAVSQAMMVQAGYLQLGLSAKVEPAAVTFGRYS